MVHILWILFSDGLVAEKFAEKFQIAELLQIIKLREMKKVFTTEENSGNRGVSVDSVISCSIPFAEQLSGHLSSTFTTIAKKKGLLLQNLIRVPLRFLCVSLRLCVKNHLFFDSGSRSCLLIALRRLP